MSDNIVKQGSTNFNDSIPTSVITFREFVSPHHYNYGDCMMKDGIAYQCKILEGISGFFKYSEWTNLGFAPDATISAALTAILNGLQRQMDINTNEIERLNRLIGLLVFELDAQGIEIDNEELINELKYI